MFGGLINVYKEKGLTSQRVVSKVKRLLKAEGLPSERVGHLGTLDPDAEGVLPVGFGRATRLFDYTLDKIKVYEAVFEFGKTTNTLDASGVITEISPCNISVSNIQKVLPELTGTVSQMPPLYSAKSVNGVRAYKLARSGQAVELKPKTVNIYDVSLLSNPEPNVFSFKITCGGGTYIRSLARDMATALGTVGFMKSLNRTQSGVFTIESAHTLEELEKGVSQYVLPMEFALTGFPFYNVEEELREKMLNGVPVEINNAPDGNFVLFFDDNLIGIAVKDEENKIKIKTRLL